LLRGKRLPSQGQRGVAARLDATDGDGNDIVNGGPGSDDCTGDATDRFISCERINRI
jgi:hypothetical protein